jgi:hypothetical protein
MSRSRPSDNKIVAGGSSHGRLGGGSKQQVIQLRQAKARGEQITPLAREFGVSIAAACNAATGRTWKTLEMAA